MSRLGDLKSLLTQRWQAPLALVALVVAGLTLYRMRPGPPEAPFEALLGNVIALAEAGRFHDATDAAANLLEAEPPLPAAQRAALHDLLADTIYRAERMRERPLRANVELLLEHHREAYRLGHPLDALGVVRAAQAHEWLGDVQVAIRGYRAALERQPTAAQRRTILHALARLLEDRPEYELARREYIEALLAEGGVAPAYLWSALRQAVEEALDSGELERAHALLTQYEEHFARSDLQGYQDFLWARVLIASGQTDRAAPRIARIRAWLAAYPRLDPELDAAGFLPALTEWLAGELELAEMRPQGALRQFERAIRLQSHGDVLVYGTIGAARALAMLERDEAARKRIRGLIAACADDGALLGIAQPRLRALAVSLSGAAHEADKWADAVAYAQLALELTPPDDPQRLAAVERVGHESAWAAERAGAAARAVAYHALAGGMYEQAARRSTLNDARYTLLLWSSAEQYERAGRRADARRVLQEFVAGRDMDDRMPQALLRLGQSYAIDGFYADATRWLSELIERYPGLEEAAQARLLRATSLIAMGPDHHAAAEAALLDLLESELLAPGARVYRDALLALCSLYYEQQRFADAIGRMEDLLAFYPDGAQAARVSFMLADCYRQSAYELRAAPPPAAGAADDSRDPAPQALPATALEDESRRRFAKAAELFARCVAGRAVDEGGEADGAPYERLALLYRGDCLYELRGPLAWEEALSVYRQAGARYQDEPTALTAQVQIANIYLRQGKLREAASAVERARWLLANIPAAHFARAPRGLDRAGWQRYLAAVTASHAFEAMARGR